MRTTRKYRKTYNRTTTRRQSQTSRRQSNASWSTQSRTRSYSPTTYPCTAPAFKQPRTECQWRIGSYKNIYSQFTGAGKQTMLSPTTANRWVKYINSGYRVYKFSNTHFTRYFGSQWNQHSTTACHKWMKQKYGTGIKAVTRANNNWWLVAATPNVTARPFQTYNWK